MDEGDGRETRKPHGFVLDFVGIFDKLEKALAFDSDEINAIVKDLGLLKVLFKNKMEQKAPRYLKLVTRGFNDKDVDDLIEHFRDKERRKEFFKEFKELEMLYEIISPDVFLRPYIDDYTSLASIYAVVAKAYTKQVYVDRGVPAKDERAGAEARHVQPHRRRDRFCRHQRGDDRPDQAEAWRRRHEGHQPDQEHREDGGRGIGRPVPDRDGRPGQAGPGKLRGPADVDAGGAGRTVCRDQAERAAQEGAGREGL